MRILTVVDYDEMWPTLFENERTLLQMTLGKVISRIHHIGSTSVPGLSAKPVIDILIEVANLEELDSLNQAMEGVGYTVRGENGILNRRYFTKGGNQRSHHIHAFATGDAQIIKHLAFRDYLIKHNDVAIQYALMKKSAMLLCENDSHRYSILGSLEVSSMGLGCLPMVGYYGGGPRDRKQLTASVNDSRQILPSLPLVRIMYIMLNAMSYSITSSLIAASSHINTMTVIPFMHVNAAL